MCIFGKNLNEKLKVGFINKYSVIDTELNKLYKTKSIFIHSNTYLEYITDVPIFSEIASRVSDYLVSELISVYTKSKLNGLLRISLVWYLLVLIDGNVNNIHFLSDTIVKCSINEEVYVITIESEPLDL